MKKENAKWVGTAQDCPTSYEALIESLPQELIEPVTFNGGCFLRKHLKVEGLGALRRIYFLSVGRILSRDDSRLDYAQAEESYTVCGEDEDGIKVFTEALEGEDEVVKPRRVNQRKILAVDWKQEIPEGWKVESSLTFILGEYTGGEVKKLGEMTEGKMDGIYKSLQTEMTNFILEDWRV